MPGYKVFANNSILTADELNTYLMRQVTIIVTDQAGRDEIVAPSEGMRVYRLDLHRTERYDGTTWVDLDGKESLQLTGSTYWLSPYASTSVWLYRNGPWVTIEGLFTGTINSSAGGGGTEALQNIPAAFRPKTRNQFVNIYSGTGYMGSLFVRPDGTGGLVNPSAVNWTGTKQVSGSWRTD